MAVTPEELQFFWDNLQGQKKPETPAVTLMKETTDETCIQLTNGALATAIWNTEGKFKGQLHSIDVINLPGIQNKGITSQHVHMAVGQVPEFRSNTSQLDPRDISERGDGAYARALIGRKLFGNEKMLIDFGRR